MSNLFKSIRNFLGWLLSFLQTKRNADTGVGYELKLDKASVDAELKRLDDIARRKGDRSCCLCAVSDLFGAIITRRANTRVSACDAFQDHNPVRVAKIDPKPCA